MMPSGSDQSEITALLAEAARPRIAQEARELVGQRVRITLQGDPAYGVTLRWAHLVSVYGTTATFWDYEDCNGVIGEYPQHSGTVTKDIAHILEIRQA